MTKQVYKNYCKYFVVYGGVQTWRQKSIDEEKNITACPKEEDPNEDSKKTLSLRTLKTILSMRILKRTLITVKPKGNAIDRDPQEIQDPH